jgi:ADP-ribosyl-[dinitrogen reductase] hydrolase
MLIKNSRTSPLRIAEVLLGDGEGRLGLTLCPGKKDALYSWDRDLKEDMRAIRAWGASTIVTLIEDHEFQLLAIENLEHEVRAHGMEWRHLPIRDVDVPDRRFEDAWEQIGAELHDRLDGGDRILIHCRGGLGRTGLVAGLLLVERGCDPSTAVRRVRAVRPHAIETAAQERYVLNAKARAPKEADNHVPDFRSRVSGCLLGGAIGDALGAPVEFMRLTEIKARFGPPGIAEYAKAYGRIGAITDDTQMTLFTAEGLLRAYARGNQENIFSVPTVVCHAYLRWLLTQGVTPTAKDLEIGKDGWLWNQKTLHSRRAPGNTCISSLKGMTRFTDERAKNDSKGAGAIMRVAPVACVAGSGDEKVAEEVFKLGMEVSWITHGHPSGYLSAAAFAVILHALLWEHSMETGIQRARTLLAREDDSGETLAAIDVALACVEKRMEPESAIQMIGEAWVGEEALGVAIYCALMTDDFASGVRVSVNHDGDSDTTGLLVGQLLGAIYGEAAIPAHWLRDLEAQEIIRQVFDDLCEYSKWNLEDPAQAGSVRERYPGW